MRMGTDRAFGQPQPHRDVGHGGPLRILDGIAVAYEGQVHLGERSRLGEDRVYRRELIGESDGRSPRRKLRTCERELHAHLGATLIRVR